MQDIYTDALSRFACRISRGNCVVKKPYYSDKMNNYLCNLCQTRSMIIPCRYLCAICNRTFCLFHYVEHLNCNQILDKNTFSLHFKCNSTLLKFESNSIRIPIKTIKKILSHIGTQFLELKIFNNSYLNAITSFLRGRNNIKELSHALYRIICIQ
jgi:hypothetical protein